MAQQAVVTDYFTRKRQRGFAQPSKRRKLIHVSDDHCSLKNKADVVQTKSNRCVQSSEDIAAAQLTQSSTRKLKQSKLSEKFSSLQEYFSPVSKRNDIDDLARSSSSLLPEECCATTASSDNHNIPLSPSKRSLSNNVDKQSKNKRGRISPRKESASAYDFPTPANDPETNFTQILSCKSRKSSRKRLVLTTTTEEVPAEASQDIKLTKASQMAKQLLSKKETSLNDLQEVLKSKGRLKDLQETLLKVKALKKQVKEAGTKETKPEKKQVTTKKDYAYQRLHSLAQDIPRGLSLPYKFKVLQEMFKSADTVISMLFNRQETATWLKVQGAVKDMIRKTFQQKDLGKIAHVFPTAYKYRQERGVPTYNDCMKKTDYQLTIEPVLPEKETSYGEGVPKLTSGLLVQRRHHFHLKMLEIVKQHHQQFLNELDPPLKVNSDELRRWHPQFALDKVPDIPSAELPSPPDQEQRKCCSAKDALEKTKGRLTKKAIEALCKVAEKYTPEKTGKLSGSESNERNNNSSPNIQKRKGKAVKGISQSLLAKVREKEAQQKLKSMIRSDIDERKIEKLKQLPDVAKSLRTLFVSEKKGSLSMVYLSSKLAKCCPFVATPALMEDHLRLLADVTAPWLSFTTVRKQEYARLDKDVQISVVLAKLQNQIKLEEKS
ncbi:DNA replication factor Cdt1-like [Clavelina lepadiformis]|uniref:DNA replication factor Cdt1-like n=1 Tax=Clavelina lepadiformis TaxID=159417 RepID=UPI0040423169